LKAHLTGRLSLSFIYLNSLPPNERFQWLERLQRKNERRDFCACQVGPSKAARAGGVESAAWQLSNFAKNIIGAVPEPRDRQLCSLQKKQNTGRRVWQENVGSSENNVGRQWSKPAARSAMPNIRRCPPTKSSRSSSSGNHTAGGSVNPSKLCRVREIVERRRRAKVNHLARPARCRKGDYWDCSDDIGCSRTSSKSFWSSMISVRMPPRVSHHRSGSKLE
jgi:hypothetical protein